MPILTSRTLPRTELTPEDQRMMYALFAEYFTGTAPALFARDLANKNWVIVLRDEMGQIQGFSTLALYPTMVQGQTLSVVYSGDTLIRREFWGTPELPKAWIKSVLRLSVGLPQPLYWLLISSGYKTYRFLPVFYKEFYPRYEAPTPPDQQALLDVLALARFGTDYDAARGVVRFAAGATPLRAGVAALDEERLRDPHVAFFVAQNPGHAQGEELVCLTRIHPDNFTAAGRRMAR